MPPRPDVSEERTQQILQAASQVFAEKGFYKARMDDIAAKARLSKGALYLYFKSKDAIIIALLDRLFVHEMRDLRALQQAEGPARERLERFVETLIANLPRWMQVIPVAYEFLGLIFRNQTVRQAFQQYLRAYVSLVQPIIEQGVASGEFRPLDAGDVALALGALLEGTMLLWVYDSERVDVARNARAGLRLILEGLLA